MRFRCCKCGGVICKNIHLPPSPSQFAPLHSSPGHDKGHGWALNNPIQKLIEFKNHLLGVADPPRPPRSARRSARATTRSWIDKNQDRAAQGTRPCAMTALSPRPSLMRRSDSFSLRSENLHTRLRSRRESHRTVGVPFYTVTGAWRARHPLPPSQRGSWASAPSSLPSSCHS